MPYTSAWRLPTTHGVTTVGVESMAEPNNFGWPSLDLEHRATRAWQSFHDAGGIVTGDAYGALLRLRCDRPVSVLARWIVDRRVVSLEAGGQLWLPLFQFDPATAAVREDVAPVIAQLINVFDALELADWFVSQNAWLGDATPLAMLASDAAAVMQAARADHFLLAG